MAIWQGRSKRKPSGGILRHHRKKRKFEIGREKIETTIGKEKYKKLHTRGGNQKIRVMIAEYVNVVDKNTKKTTRTKISSVLENPANPHYVRRNIITKGAIVQTEIGRAKITSRPGQDRTLNAILVEDLKKGVQTPPKEA